jgi:hypothetical protein
MSYPTKLTSMIAVFLAVSLAGTTAITSSVQKANSIGSQSTGAGARQAPMAISGDNIYIAWWSNKTGNDEVMFKASTDNGKTFGHKMNLSNSTNADSQDVQIAAAGSNVYVSWWERNATSNEPVLRVSNDNGKTFGEKIMLSNNATTAKPSL